MAQQLSTWLLILVHCSGLLSETNSKIIYIRSSGSTSNFTCPTQPCLSLDDHAQELKSYLLDNTTFTFLPGVHHLHVRLLVKNISHFSLQVHSKLANDSVQIFLSPLVKITWIDCVDVQA